MCVPQLYFPHCSTPVRIPCGCSRCAPHGYFERMFTRQAEPEAVPSRVREARVRQASSERRSRASFAAPDFAVLTATRAETPEDTAYSEPSVRAFNRGRRPSRRNVFEAPMAHAAAVNERVSRQPLDRIVDVGRIRRPVQTRLTEPTVRAERRGQAAAPLSQTSGLWRFSVPMQHIETVLPEAEETVSSPINRAALRSVNVPSYDSRGGRRSNPSVTGHVRTAERIRRMQPALDRDTSIPRRSQKTIARIPERATAGTAVASQFRGGLRAVPTSYLQAQEPLQQADAQRVRISVYGVRPQRDISRRFESIRETDGNGAGRIMPAAVPRIQERAVQPLMSIPFARMESRETPRGAAPRIRPFGFTRAPQTEFLSFSDAPETVEHRTTPARPCRAPSARVRKRCEHPTTTIVRSGSMAYASARLSVPAAVGAETRRQERLDTRHVSEAADIRGCCPHPHPTWWHRKMPLGLMMHNL